MACVIRVLCYGNIQHLVVLSVNFEGYDIGNKGGPLHAIWQPVMVQSMWHRMNEPSQCMLNHRCTCICKEVTNNGLS